LVGFVPNLWSIATVHTFEGTIVVRFALSIHGVVAGSDAPLVTPLAFGTQTVHDHYIHVCIPGHLKSTDGILKGTGHHLSLGSTIFFAYGVITDQTLEWEVHIIATFLGAGVQVP